MLIRAKARGARGVGKRSGLPRGGGAICGRLLLCAPPARGQREKYVYCSDKARIPPPANTQRIHHTAAVSRPIKTARGCVRKRRGVIERTGVGEI